MFELHGESTCSKGKIDYGCYYRKNSCRNSFRRKVGIGSRSHCLLGEACKSLAISWENSNDFPTVLVYETVKFNLSQWFVFEIMTFKKLVNIMSYNVAEFVIGWSFNGLRNGEKMVDISQTVYVQFNNKTFK